MKTYVKPVLYQRNIAPVCSNSACGKTSYGGCGKLVQRDV